VRMPSSNAADTARRARRCAHANVERFSAAATPR
jgi:hypothetical protein